MKIQRYSGSILWDVWLCYPNSEDWNTLIVATINLSEYAEENQGICLHQARLIHYFGKDHTPLLTHVIQYRIQVRSGYFINQVRPAWPRQNVTRLTWITQMTQPSFNPGQGTQPPEAIGYSTFIVALPDFAIVLLLITFRRLTTFIAKFRKENILIVLVMRCIFSRDTVKLSFLCAIC